MPKRPRHIDLDLVRAVNPEGEDLLAPAASDGRLPDAEASALPERQARAAAALKAIGEFVLEYPRGRYGGGRRPVDVGQALGLSEALLQAMALLLKKDPEHLRWTLEEVVYGDLSEAALAEARRSLGILNRKTLKELLDGSEPSPSPVPTRIKLVGTGPSASDMILEDREGAESYDWGGTDPETLGAPIRLTHQGPVVEWPEGDLGQLPGR